MAVGTAVGTAVGASAEPESLPLWATQNKDKFKIINIKVSQNGCIVGLCDTDERKLSIFYCYFMQESDKN
ncbi:MAG TPA: hypothetical protein GXX18_10905 [Bacillales bacterium]|nr:hypothetical protein [Bacillales bacterium]